MDIVDFAIIAALLMGYWYGRNRPFERFRRWHDEYTRTHDVGRFHALLWIALHPVKSYQIRQFIKKNPDIRPRRAPAPPLAPKWAERLKND